MAAGDGLVTMTPTSIAVAGAGSSASINSDGGVDFTSATSLSLNGVFTSSYDNYLVVYGPVSAASGYPAVTLQLRVSGTNATGANYTDQYFYVSGTGATTGASRSTGRTSAAILSADNDNRGGAQLHIYGPGLAQPTAMRSLQVVGDSGADLYDIASTHSLSTAYDGFTIAPSSSSITGNIVVFGYEE